MRKFVTDIENFITDIENNGTEAEILPFSSEFLGHSPPSIWGFRNDGPGVVAIYCGPAGGPILERCELQPDDVMELRGAHFVLQSRDRLGAVVFIASP
ncbi:MAG: hypothetical protein E6G76_17755 [Alphaproteobacteria bacterium]|jgi:hypothetical protein|nr:MAG: hypothetical protein E6G76_17755 [Alphaproteobacteria bacterium]